MHYDTDDTIAAIGTATGGAVRGMVRLSGPRVLECLASCFCLDEAELQLSDIRSPRVIAGSIQLATHQLATHQLATHRLVGHDGFPESLQLPCHLLLWPSNRSYTRQPTAELHTLGAPPLLEKLLSTVCGCGARLAEPGEFTLRAFLAGRLDLTQAEAVLGVIDAHSSNDLHAALAQLAGGLSQPLALLREKLLHLLAELEAGLDFVEEDIEFISAPELHEQLTAAATIVARVASQLTSRGEASDLPRVALCGLPNAGKSSLFNAIVERYALHPTEPRALVSEQSGTTRDFITAIVKFKGLTYELVDTAGVELIKETGSIGGRSQELSGQQREQANLVVRCEVANDAIGVSSAVDAGEIAVRTKGDLLTDSPSLASQLVCSSVDGSGLETLVHRIYEAITDADNAASGSLSLTATRCAESLRHAQAALERALQLVEHHGGEELVAAEVREALHALGQVVGAVYTEDILDRIFGQFCIGK